jgi:hypothetical protein
MADKAVSEMDIAGVLDNKTAWENKFFSCGR